MIKYYSITIPQFILETECIEEILRERTNYELKEKTFKQFWIMPTSSFFSSTQMYEESLNKNVINKIFSKKDQNKKYPILFTIISTNSEFIVWLKIRLGSFIDLGKYDLIDNEIKKILSNSKQESFTSNIGFYSEFLVERKNQEQKIINNSLLKYNKNYIQEKVG